jgi:two-component system sensor histidine kinase BaeS
MKLGITYRLFLLILSATSLAIIFLLLIMWWNINQGFYDYLGEVGQKRLAQFIDDIEKNYAKKGNWNFLKETPPRWNSGGAKISWEQEMGRTWEPFHNNEPPMGPPSGYNMNRPPLPPPDKYGHDHKPPMGPHPPGEGHHPPDPLVILNADKEPIYGSYPHNEKIKLHPVIVQKITVGYVGLLSPRHFLDPMQIQFLGQQKLALVWGAAGIVLIVIIISFPLSRQMVKPIKEMASATHDIASGKYTTRVSFSSTDELGQLARDFNAMALTLEKHEKERRQWVADISHELRTPVSVLQGEIEALLDGIRKITPETIHSLHAETLRLKRLVEDLYQISLSDLGALNYRKDNLDPVEAIKDSLKSYREEFDRKGIALNENIDKNIKAVCFADRERLSQLFTNLLENSLRYTDKGGILEVGMKVSNDFIIIEFQDSNPGVSEKDLEKLFDRFYRVEASRNRTYGGAGLGLTICKNIVDAHEGLISAHPSPLGGIRIQISIPILGGRK